MNPRKLTDEEKKTGHGCGKETPIVVAETVGKATICRHAGHAEYIHTYYLSDGTDVSIDMIALPEW